MLKVSCTLLMMAVATPLMQSMSLFAQARGIYELDSSSIGGSRHRSGTGTGTSSSSSMPLHRLVRRQERSDEVAAKLVLEPSMMALRQEQQHQEPEIIVHEPQQDTVGNVSEKAAEDEAAAAATKQEEAEAAKNLLAIHDINYPTVKVDISHPNRLVAALMKLTSDIRWSLFMEGFSLKRGNHISNALLEKTRHEIEQDPSNWYQPLE